MMRMHATPLSASAVLWVLLSWLSVPPLQADVVETVEGNPQAGRWAGARPDAVLWQAERGGRQELKIEDVVRIEFDGAAAPAGQAPAQVMLSNGDRVAGEVLGSGDWELKLRSPLLGELSLPMRQVSAIVLGREAPAPLVEQLAKNDTDHDWVLLRNGERLPGVVKALGRGELTFSGVIGEATIPFERVVAVSLARAQPVERGAGVLAVVELSDGSRISGRLVEGDEERMTLAAVGKDLLTFRFRGAVKAVEFRGGRRVYLSDLEPERVEQAAYLGRVWAYRRDRAVGGGPLSLRGKVYRKGLGVHARARLAYRLRARYTRFQAEIGIDDAAGGRGDAAFRVLADGRTVFERASVGGDEPAVPIDLDVRGVRELELVVGFGAGLDVADHADWAAARVDRAASKDGGRTP